MKVKILILFLFSIIFFSSFGKILTGIYGVNSELLISVENNNVKGYYQNCTDKEKLSCCIMMFEGKIDSINSNIAYIDYYNGFENDKKNYSTGILKFSNSDSTLTISSYSKAFTKSTCDNISNTPKTFKIRWNNRYLLDFTYLKCDNLLNYYKTGTALFIRENYRPIGNDSITIGIYRFDSDPGLYIIHKDCIYK